VVAHVKKWKRYNRGKRRRNPASPKKTARKPVGNTVSGGIGGAQAKGKGLAT